MPSATGALTVGMPGGEKHGGERRRKLGDREIRGQRGGGRTREEQKQRGCEGKAVSVHGNGHDIEMVGGSRSWSWWEGPPLSLPPRPRRGR